MATGTGKTYAALYSLVRLLNEKKQKLGIIICCPYYQCPVCGKRASQEKMLERKKAQLQGLANLYFEDKEGYSQKKKEISLLRKKAVSFQNLFDKAGSFIYS